MATVKRSRFELEGADGGPLRGEVRAAGGGEARPAAVICHGFKGFKDWGFFPHLAERIARAGITAVTFNFSGSGVGPEGDRFSEPDRFTASTYSRDLAELDTVVRALEAGTLAGGFSPPPRVGLVGHSRGGAAAIIFAAERAERAGRGSIGCLVTWNAVARLLRWGPETLARWRAQGRLDVVNTRTGEVLPMGLGLLDDYEANSERLDVLRAAGRIRLPWLIVQGEIDESVPAREARELLPASGRESTVLRLVARGSHTFGAQHPWAGPTPQLDEAMDATLDWICKNLL